MMKKCVGYVLHGTNRPMGFSVRAIISAVARREAPRKITVLETLSPGNASSEEPSSVAPPPA
jgi:hypothetical protein